MLNPLTAAEVAQENCRKKNELTDTEIRQHEVSVSGYIGVMQAAIVLACAEGRFEVATHVFMETSDHYVTRRLLEFFKDWSPRFQEKVITLSWRPTRSNDGS